MNIIELGASSPLTRKLHTLAELAEAERQALQDLPVTLKVLTADHDIAR